MPGEIAVVVHPRPLMLSLAHPWLPAARMVSAPAGRRYFAGFFGRNEIHVLAPSALEARASGVPGSREAMMLSPRHEYAHLVVGANNSALPPPFTPGTFRRYVRMAWVSEGSATYLAGQVPPHARGGGAAAARGRAARRSRHRRATRWCLAARCSTSWRARPAPAAADALALTRTPEAALAAVESALDRPAASIARGWENYLEGFAAG